MNFLKFCRRAVLFEIGSALLLFGSLSNDAKFREIAAQAINELAARGYAVPTSEQPLRIYPAEGSSPGGEFGALHAARWQPGLIVIREAPVGQVPVEAYLRHEIFHELSHRTCPGKLAVWAEEAGAIAFGGEISLAQPYNSSFTSITELAARVMTDAPLNQAAYFALQNLVNQYGWPEEPCAVSPEIFKLLNAGKSNPSGSQLDYIIASAISGRVFASEGKIYERRAPGSLLKIPYAASLSNVNDGQILKALAGSNTEALFNLRTNVDRERFNQLLGMPKPASGSGDQDWRAALGQRNIEQLFDFEPSLPELGEALRLSLLTAPQLFKLYSNFSDFNNSTLNRASNETISFIRERDAIFKTGTVSNLRGDPLGGHFFIAWPADKPILFAVFRRSGVRGAALADEAARILKDFLKEREYLEHPVRVRLFSAAQGGFPKVTSDCGGLFEIEGSAVTSRCGSMLLEAPAAALRRVRKVYGKLLSDQNAATLETDPETYADAVIEAEGDALHAEAKAALRAVVVWNAAHAASRHGRAADLCDSTHCMVFLGAKQDQSRESGANTRPELVRLLREKCSASGTTWAHFSKGGSEVWRRQLSAEELAEIVQEDVVIDIRRERTRSGLVQFDLLYPDSMETVPCEVLRTRLRLPSCPDAVEYSGPERKWIFSGIGEGHGLGLDVLYAEERAKRGEGAFSILESIFREY